MRNLLGYCTFMSSKNQKIYSHTFVKLSNFSNQVYVKSFKMSDLGFISNCQVLENLQSGLTNNLVNNISEDISGTWKNELGSIVEFIAEVNGNLQGHYKTNVGNAIVNELSGRWFPAENSSAIIGFSVCWSNRIDTNKPLSVSSWSGTMKMDSNDNTLKLKTTWILCSDEKQDNTWKSFTINQDIFVKQ